MMKAKDIMVKTKEGIDSSPDFGCGFVVATFPPVFEDVPSKFTDFTLTPVGRVNEDKYPSDCAVALALSESFTATLTFNVEAELNIRSTRVFASD